jgi:hypothetical protein
MDDNSLIDFDHFPIQFISVVQTASLAITVTSSVVILISIVLYIADECFRNAQQTASNMNQPHRQHTNDNLNRPIRTSITNRPSTSSTPAAAAAQAQQQVEASISSSQHIIVNTSLAVPPANRHTRSSSAPRRELTVEEKMKTDLNVKRKSLQLPVKTPTGTTASVEQSPNTPVEHNLEHVEHEDAAEPGPEDLRVSRGNSFQASRGSFRLLRKVQLHLVSRTSSDQLLSSFDLCLSRLHYCFSS